MVRDWCRFTISVFFLRSKNLMTHFLGAFEYLVFVTNCNDIHMHHEKGRSHSLVLIHFQGCKCRGRVACKFPRYNFICQAGVLWLTRPVAFFYRESFTGVRRPCRFFKYGEELWISRCKKIKNLDN